METIRTGGRVGAVVVMVAALSMGCVSRGKYNDLESERNELQANRDALAEEVAALQSERDELSEGLAAVEAEKQAMSNTYTELVGELQGEVAAGQVEIQQILNGVRLNVSQELLFGSGAATLDEAGRGLIVRVAEQIKDEAAVITVEGHTDDVAVGPALRKVYPTNWELAGARAASVVRLLAENGVDPTQLRAVSRGPFAPLVPNDSEENRAKNRRTEIILRPIEQ